MCRIYPTCYRRHTVCNGRRYRHLGPVIPEATIMFSVVGESVIWVLMISTIYTACCCFSDLPHLRVDVRRRDVACETRRKCVNFCARRDVNINEDKHPSVARICSLVLLTLRGTPTGHITRVSVYHATHVFLLWC